MAKFTCHFESFEKEGGAHGSIGYSNLTGTDKGAGLSTEDLLSILRPAAERIQEHYKSVIARLFGGGTGELAESIKIDENAYASSGTVSVTIGPKGRRKKGKKAARTRAGSADRKYAKHNREAKSTSLTNPELAYLLEFGTPRIAATHWMENANEEIEEEIRAMIEAGFDECLKRKGL